MPDARKIYSTYGDEQRISPATLPQGDGSRGGGLRDGGQCARWERARHPRLMRKALLPVRKKPLTGAVLRIGWAGAPANLDPISASADTEIALLNAIYDYLVDTDVENNLVPRLATDWEVSDDGLTYTVTIAEGVTFHNGDPLTLDDIIWTFDRLRSPDTATADLFANIESIEPGEGNTLVFTLTEPNPDFMYTLTDNHAVILQANAENIGSEFNGTGPFILDSYTPADRATLSANPNYFQGAPGVAGIEFLFLGDNEAAVNALRGGVIDAVMRLDNATYLSLVDDPGFNAVEVPTRRARLVRLRADREPGSDARARGL